MKGGARLEGTLLEVSSETLSVQLKTRTPGPPRDVPLTAIESIEPGKRGMSVGKKVLIGAGVALGIVALLAELTLSR
jgi:hypothetical protein